MKFIHPDELWLSIRLPEVPTTFHGWPDLTETQNEEMSRALDLLRLLQKPEGGRRTVNGLNRAGQKRWPERGWNICDVERIAEAWKVAGMRSLADLIVKGRQNSGYGPCYGMLDHVPKTILAIRRDPPDSAEVFVSATLLVKQSSNPDIAWFIYRMRIESSYGFYSFCLAESEPPDDWWAMRYCIFHTEVRASERHQPVK